MKNHGIRSKKVSFKISLMYILFSIFWICTSEWLVTKVHIDEFFWISIVKGILFIVATGFLLYKLIERNIKNIENREQQLNSLIENNMDAIIQFDSNSNFISVNHVTG